MLNVESLLALLQSIAGRFIVDRYGDGGVRLRGESGQNRASDIETDLYNLAKAAGFEVRQSRDAKSPDYYGSVYVCGEVSDDTDLRRLAVEAGIRLEFGHSNYQLTSLLAGVNLADADLTQAAISGFCDQANKLVADFRGARPVSAFRVDGGCWDPGVHIKTLDLARCQFDAEQMETIVRLVEGAGHGLAVLRNPACTAEQVERVTAVMPEDVCGLLQNLLCAPNLPEARVRELAASVPGEELDVLLSDSGLHPVAREVLVGRRMALAPEPWRSLPSASIVVGIVAEVDRENPDGDFLVQFRLDENEFPRDAFQRLGEWWHEDADGHRFQLFIREDGQLTGSLIADHYDEDARRSYGQLVGVLVDPTNVFAGHLSHLLAERLARQDANIVGLRAEYERKLAEAQAVRDRLARLAG